MEYHFYSRNEKAKQTNHGREWEEIKIIKRYFEWERYRLKVSIRSQHGSTNLHFSCTYYSQRSSWGSMTLHTSMIISFSLTTMMILKRTRRMPPRCCCSSLRNQSTWQFECCWWMVVTYQIFLSAFRTFLP